MAKRISLILIICAVNLALGMCSRAQGPISNPSFEQGSDGWTKYSYQLTTNESPAQPSVGCIGSSGCPFGLLHTPPAPDGSAACGIQSYETTGNGGVCQTFNWSGGPACIQVSARAYSERYDGTPYDNGCLVRIGLVSGATQDRGLVAWTRFPWRDAWLTRALRVPGSGTYTLFIEAEQPNSSAVMSTLWDNVRFSAQPPVLTTSGPTASADSQQPDTVVTVTWTTDTPSTSSVDYGTTSSYGATVGSTDLVTQHSVTITGLAHSTQYHFRATSTAAGCVDWTSDDLTFNTPIWFSGITTEPAGGNSVTVHWSTDVAATSQVEYWWDGDPHSSTALITTLSTDHNVTLTGLVGGRQYNYRVWSRNTAGHTDACSAVMTFWTLPPVSPVLLNGGFEDSGAQGHSLNPWVQYTVEEGAAGYHPIDGLVGPYSAGGASSWLASHGTDGSYFAGVRAFDGSYFVGAGANAAYKNGGVFQRVMANPGDFYTLTARFLTHREGGENGYTKVRIGVDPAGGVDPRASTIKWWSGYSDTNDDQWHSAAVTVLAGEGGVATIFLEFQEKLPIRWHVAAVDGVTFSTPFPCSIGTLKASKGNLGAVLENKTVTCVYPTAVSYEGNTYTKLYVEEDNRSAGLAVLIPRSSPNAPVAGNKLTVTGALGVYDREASFMAASWSVDPGIYPLPKPLAMSQLALGKAGPNQPVVAGGASGLTNVGLRVRICGRVKSLSYGSPVADMMAYIDDGSKLQDGGGIGGIRTYLYNSETLYTYEDDYIAVTGVLGTQKVDHDGWPDNGDEYYIYVLCTQSPTDWNRCLP